MRWSGTSRSRCRRWRRRARRRRRARPLVVTVLADGRVELDGTPVTLDELTARLAAARTPLTEPTVVIRGDAECAFQHVASALAACQQAGISELGITVRIAGIGKHDALMTASCSNHRCSVGLFGSVWPRCRWRTCCLWFARWR